MISRIAVDIVDDVWRVPVVRWVVNLLRQTSAIILSGCRRCNEQQDQEENVLHGIYHPITSTFGGSQANPELVQNCSLIEDVVLLTTVAPTNGK